MALICYGCGPAFPEQPTEEEGKLPVEAAPNTPVNTAVAQNKPFEYHIRTAGKIIAAHEQMIYSGINGNLLALKAATGKHVTAGSLLAKLDTFLIKSRLERGWLARFNSEKEYESLLLGYENLLRTRSKEQTDDIKQKLKISSGLAGAEQDIKEAEYALSQTIIKAPFAGIIADVKVQQGQELKAGEEMFLIYDPSVFYLDARILEADLPLVQIGTNAVISPVSTPELNFAAAIHEINPRVDKDGLIAVKLKVIQHRNYNYPLFPGMNCTILINSPLQKAIIVPKNAVVMRNGQTILFTIKEGRAKWNYVTVGRDNGEEVEIKQGIQPGEIVITSNNLQLSNNAPVRATVATDSMQHKEK